MQREKRDMAAGIHVHSVVIHLKTKERGERWGERERIACVCVMCVSLCCGVRMMVTQLCNLSWKKEEREEEKRDREMSAPRLRGISGSTIRFLHSSRNILSVPGALVYRSGRKKRRRRGETRREEEGRKIMIEEWFFRRSSNRKQFLSLNLILLPCYVLCLYCYMCSQYPATNRFLTHLFSLVLFFSPSPLINLSVMSLEFLFFWWIRATARIIPNMMMIPFLIQCEQQKNISCFDPVWMCVEFWYQNTRQCFCCKRIIFLLFGWQEIGVFSFLSLLPFPI